MQPYSPSKSVLRQNNSIDITNENLIKDELPLLPASPSKFYYQNQPHSNLYQQTPHMQTNNDYSMNDQMRDISAFELQQLISNFDLEDLMLLEKHQIIQNQTGALNSLKSLLKQDQRLQKGEIDTHDYQDSQDDMNEEEDDEDDTLGNGEYLKQEDFPIVTKQMKDYFDGINPPPMDEFDNGEANDLEEILRNEKLQLQQMYPELLLQNPHLQINRPKKSYKRRESSLYRRDQDDGFLLPFRTKRYEKVNNNGEEKQIKAEAKRVRVNDRVKKRQRLLREEKMLEIQKLIDAGQLTVEALKWKIRRDPTEMTPQQRQLQIQRKLYNSGMMMNPNDPHGPMIKKEFSMKKNGEPRMASERWSDEDHNRFVKALKTVGKNWKQIATDVGTKNEQQCRTRGLIIFNRLTRHCWDEELKQILTPHQGYQPRDVLEKKRELKMRNKENKLIGKVDKRFKPGKSLKVSAQQNSNMVDQETTTDISLPIKRTVIQAQLQQPKPLFLTKPFMIINERNHLYQKGLVKQNEIEDPESDIIKVSNKKKPIVKCESNQQTQIQKKEDKQKIKKQIKAETAKLDQNVKVQELNLKDQENSLIQSSQEGGEKLSQNQPKFEIIKVVQDIKPPEPKQQMVNNQLQKKPLIQKRQMLVKPKVIVSIDKRSITKTEILQSQKQDKKPQRVSSRVNIKEQEKVQQQKTSALQKSIQSKQKMLQKKQQIRSNTLSNTRSGGLRNCIEKQNKKDSQSVSSSSSENMKDVSTNLTTSPCK
eukprot:403340050